MRTYSIVSFIIIFIFFFAACQRPELIEGDNSEFLSGGKQTVFTEGMGAFSQAFPKMNGVEEALHEEGDKGFSVQFVSYPSTVSPGLGPIFNNNACVSCHINDGRGKPPEPGEQMKSILFRLSVPGNDEHGGPMPAPGYGGQLQPLCVYGSQAEAGIQFTYSERNLTGADTNYRLRYPQYTLTNPYTLVPAGMMMSPRIAPPMHGLGLLEAIPDEAILANADQGDANGDGISGKPNYVWDIKQGRMSIGRFGWKSGQPTLLQQTAGAYNEDMGITSYLMEKESCREQSQYKPGFYGTSYEVKDSILFATAFYVKTLAVPARRNVNDIEVKRGKQVFMQAKCGTCHVPTFQTRVDITSPSTSNQTIHPYTDLLVHDMGEDLADHRPDYSADGREWRTPPLWGIGLTKTVNGHNFFMHDGRARSLFEAVMWHGGEASGARHYVEQLNRTDRSALLKFLESL